MSIGHRNFQIGRERKERKANWKRHGNGGLFRNVSTGANPTANAVIGRRGFLGGFVGSTVATNNRIGANQTLHLAANRAGRPKRQHNQRHKWFQPIHETQDEQRAKDMQFRSDGQL